MDLLRNVVGFFLNSHGIIKFISSSVVKLALCWLAGTIVEQDLPKRPMDIGLFLGAVYPYLMQHNVYYVAFTNVLQNERRGCPKSQGN